jgi:hypothetical protein
VPLYVREWDFGGGEGGCRQLVGSLKHMSVCLVCVWLSLCVMCTPVCLCVQVWLAGWVGGWKMDVCVCRCEYADVCVCVCSCIL